MINFKDIDAKWQQRWEAAKAFESNPDHRKNIFTSIIIPYVNGDMHIGHAFTYTRTDIYARFKRMQGFNVLLAQGFHATGEPILGVVERLRKNDESQLRTYKLLGISDQEIEDFKQKGTEYVAKFWAERMTKSAKSIGYSIDWRRCFITAIDPCFNRFIEWQYNLLKEKGYVKQDTHPVVWCPHCQSPTGDHDRLEGEGESPIEYTLMKFELCDEFSDRKAFLPCATLRPETIYGVTNIWINPDTEYVIAIVDHNYTDVGGEVWIISKECVDKLKDQLYDVQEIGRVHASEIFGKKVIEPGSGREIPILPAIFVNPKNATGIVMSVPAHAPYDYIVLKELIDQGIEKFNTSKEQLEPITLIETEGFGENPAIDICESMGIKNQKQKEKLDNATAILYKKEFHQGFLNNKCGVYAGKKVADIKQHLINVFLHAKTASLMWEPTDRVVCRCTTECNIKILEDQWFITYSDENWKKLVLQHMENMKFYPDESRTQAENTIHWLKDKACARKTGLGTKMPWDQSWIIETLSDSTIYMAYYTIAHAIEEHNISAHQLIDEGFNYIFRNIGNSKEISKKSGLSEKIINDMKKEFEYFYPVDMRNSGKDLLQHHLMFYLFHHIAIFDRKHWPLAIGINGYVNVEGEKMSKSKGNFLALRDLVDRYGADLVRINIAAAAEAMDDADWRHENINGYRNRLNYLVELVENITKSKHHEKRLIDIWLELETNKIIKDVSIAYGEMRFRTVVQHALFDSVNVLKWYIKRVGGIEHADKTVLEECLSNIIKIISPVVPHICEEIWEKLGNKDFIFNAYWPKHNEHIIQSSHEAEQAEAFIKNTLEGINGIKKIVKKQPRKIMLFIAKATMFTDKHEKKRQFQLLNQAKQFFTDELRCETDIIDSDAVDNNASELYQKKAAAAKPEKLGIVIE